MASELITTYEAFNPETVSYGAAKINKRGGKSIKILDSKKNSLILSTPLILTWGINKMVDEDSGRASYNLAIQYPSDNYGTDATREFYSKMRDLEDKILDDAVKHSKEWFNKDKMSREVAEALYTPMLKHPYIKGTKEPDMSRAPSTKIKISYWEGKFNTELYDVNRNLLFEPDMTMGDDEFQALIPKASHIAALIQCNGIWFVGGKFGISWQLVQAVIRRPVRIQGSCFVNLSSDDKKQIETLNQQEDETVGEGEETEEHSTQVQDSEDEEEEEVKVEVQKEIEKKPKRKRNVRKKAMTEEE